MKSSIVKGVLWFAAGAGCASVVAGGWWTPPDLTPEELGARLQRVNRELAEIGVYAIDARDGVILMQPSPVACTPTPQPDIMEGRAVNPILHHRGVAAAEAYNDARVVALKTPIKVSPPCKPE